MTEAPFKLNAAAAVHADPVATALAPWKVEDYLNSTDYSDDPDYVPSEFALEFWNAGGSGSVEVTAADPVVTEVAAGSGLLVPTLFDHYRSFEPRPAAL